MCSLIFLAAGVVPVLLSSSLWRFFVLTMKQPLSSSRCFVPAKQVASVVLFGTYAHVVLLAAFLLRSCITFFNTPVVCFASPCFFFFLSLFFFLWSGLFRCVLVSGTLAFHLLYLDELRWFGLILWLVCPRNNSSSYLFVIAAVCID